MEEIIHFRTKSSRSRTVGSASKYILGRSSEASELRNALPYDDARDIVWNRSTGSSLITRNRFTQSSIDIQMVVANEPFDRDKWTYIEHIKKAFEFSTQFSGDSFSYEDVGKKKGFTNHIHEKGRLVFIITSSLDIMDYKKISTEHLGNDIVILMLFHRYELESSGEDIFDSRSPTHRYYDEMRVRIATIQKILHGGKISNILLRTDDNIIRRLNHFFKHRYG